jgi:hypothetical protein
MEQSGSIERWNRLYDEAPPHLRFQALVWGLVAVGALNMLLTIWFNFPFGLLLVAAMAAMAWIRVAPQLNLVPKGSDAPGSSWTAAPATREAPPPEMPMTFASLNQWLDGLPEFQRLGIYIAVLTVVGAINMLLTIHGEFPFGLLFLLAFALLAWIRGPWVRAKTRADYYAFRSQRRAPAPAGFLPHSADPAAEAETYPTNLPDDPQATVTR